MRAPGSPIWRNRIGRGVKIVKKLGSDESFDIVDLNMQELIQQRKRISFYE